jgi:hypothetical protein
MYEPARRYPRFAIDISVRVFLENGQRADGRGHDLGRGGLALYVAVELATGAKLRLDFVLPYSRTPLSVNAIIRNRQGFRYGIEFVQLNSEAEQELGRVCSILDLTTVTRG